MPFWFPMRHGFFADMGGFPTMAPDTDTPPFPATSKHIHWLVPHSYMDMPGVSAEERNDKSNQDTIAKVVTFFRISYLVPQCLDRVL